ncbi:MAG TPA: hypothetical protein VGI40_05110 [Pirellulaceae bacterium]|jgi:hypothetical protein
MAPLHRKFKQVQLRQVWHSDPSTIIAKYREAVHGDDLDKPPHSDATIMQMIETIIDHETADLSTANILRSIAA